MKAIIEFESCGNAGVYNVLSDDGESILVCNEFSSHMKNFWYDHDDIVYYKEIK